MVFTPDCNVRLVNGLNKIESAKHCSHKEIKMTVNPKLKLSKVLEYLIKNDEKNATALLHQVFIEKARAIHEELNSMDDMQDDEIDEMVGGSGDQGLDLSHDIEHMEDEVDFEETMGEDDEGEDDNEEIGINGDITVDDDTDGMDQDVEPDADHNSGELSAIDDTMQDLETALAELKAEFEKLEAEESGETVDHDGEEETGNQFADNDTTDDGESVDSEIDGEDDMDESWDLDEEFDDLAESLDLDVVVKDMEKGQKTEEEVGSGRSGMAIDKNAKSPLPASQKDRWGAKPVETGKGSTHNGYNLETAPKSERMTGQNDDNRRKKSTDGATKVSKEGNSAALINKTKSEFGIDTVGKMSPLSKGGNNLKG